MADVVGMLQELLPYLKVGFALYLVYAGLLVVGIFVVFAVVLRGFMRRRDFFDDFGSSRRR